ncbi:MAG: indolepyruvate ferredoxin oxidoreductase family protein, partial [Rhodospirillales bacterium]|nr:indolepyruvate ferredoxin oxidoreductase family protein [Rhodospirillales bacterium]
MDATPITLDDRYKVERGRVFLTGVQALTRLPIIQAQRDKAAGLNTGGFISGYRGSPLGGYDGALWQAQAYLDENRIKFQPAINEELAATAIIGTQQINSYPDAAVDGVFSIWYGKGPGSDRASD